MDSTYHKLTRYCAFQERCTLDVQHKMDRLGVPKDQRLHYLNQLTEEGFLDDDRFARTFVKGKFNQNQWGLAKIRMALRNKGIADPLIEEAVQSIDIDKYKSVLEEKMDRSFDSSLSYSDRQKAIASLQRKGFELNLILEILKEKGYDHIR